MWILSHSVGVLKSEEGISVLTNGTERSSFEADGSGATTIGKKRSLLIEPVARGTPSWFSRLEREEWK